MLSGFLLAFDYKSSYMYQSEKEKLWIFGGFKNHKRDKKKSNQESVLNNRIYACVFSAKKNCEKIYSEIGFDDKSSGLEKEGLGGDDTAEDEESEVSFEEMLRREKFLEKKLKNKV